MHVLTQKRFEGLEEDKIAGYSNSDRAIPAVLLGLGGRRNYRVLKHGTNLLKRLCSLGGGRNYKVLKRTLST